MYCCVYSIYDNNLNSGVQCRTIINGLIIFMVAFFDVLLYNLFMEKYGQNINFSIK